MPFYRYLGALFGLLLFAATASARPGEYFAPAELPPASYTGMQYVDSRGCVFVRAGRPGAVDWVPRVTRQREHLCGYTPTFADPIAAGAVAPGLAARPKIASNALILTSPSTSPEPAAVAAKAPVSKPLPLFVAKPKESAAPRPVTYSVPPGYQSAWNDGRLNPERGVQSAAQTARMHEIWSETVPMVLKPNVAVAKTPVAKSASAATFSTKSRAEIVPAGKSFVQIGVFGVPENADRVVAWIKSIGFPASVTLREGGTEGLRVVAIGPLNDSAALATALDAARRSGHADAYLR